MPRRPTDGWLSADAAVLRPTARRGGTSPTSKEWNERCNGSTPSRGAVASTARGIVATPETRARRRGKCARRDLSAPSADGLPTITTCTGRSPAASRILATVVFLEAREKRDRWPYLITSWAAPAVRAAATSRGHTGECEQVGGDIGGIAVHVGAGVASLAATGQILVSQTVKDIIAGSGIRLEDRGGAVLKGLPGKWQLYRDAGFDAWAALPANPGAAAGRSGLIVTGHCAQVNVDVQPRARRSVSPGAG